MKRDKINVFKVVVKNLSWYILGVNLVSINIKYLKRVGNICF